MEKLKLYWAGGLFDGKEILGNYLMAHAFIEASEGTIELLLPQDFDLSGLSAGEIRDVNYSMLFTAGAIVANFDGHDLDSGTVAEFCTAKTLDTPCVLLRTDFRNSADQGSCADPWNLMCSSFPRTESLLAPAVSSMKLDSGRVVKDYPAQLAQKLLAALIRTVASAPVLPANRRAQRMRETAELLGGKMSALFPLERIAEIIRQQKNARNDFLAAMRAKNPLPD
ncbi:MAG: nucleoside 2-deoxyribosyltransferase [Victivallaceae bacterium]|nr:nucleoside 2-deoxyribosyltransferase [Victivallaceae bacterium]